MGWPKVQPGQALQIPATLQNRLIDLASEGSTALPGSHSPQGVSAYHTTVLGWNTGAAYCPAFGVARAVGSAIDPGENLRAFLGRPVLELQPATEANAGGDLAIAANRIDAGRVGAAVVSGVVQARIFVSNESHRFAAPDLEEAWRLNSAEAGIRVLHKEAGVGLKWALLLLGAAAPAGPGVRVVAVGTAAPEVDFEAVTYTVETEAGELITGLSGDPTHPTYRSTPGVRWGEAWRVNPARVDTLGVITAMQWAGPDGPRSVRVVRLFDERIAVVPCGGG